MEGQDIFNRIANALNIIGEYSNHDILLFEKEVQIRQIRKGDILLNKGDLAKSMFFVLQGAIYQYMPKEDGSICVLDLYGEEEWLLNDQSFIGQTPSESIISAFSDSWLLEISIDSIHFLIAKSASFLQLNKILAQSTSRVYFFDHSLSPLQKYEFLFRNKPQLLQLFPLKVIASYLKITPETLSRVRERFAKGASRS